MGDEYRPRRWRYWQSSGYGLIFGMVVAACTLATNTGRWSVGYWVQTCAFYLFQGVIMFIVVAAIRNAILRAR